MDIYELTPETNNILKNLGNFPIHLRQAQKWSTPKQDTADDREVFPEKFGSVCDSNLDLAVISKDDLERKPVRTF